MLRNRFSWLRSRRWLVIPPVILGVICLASFAMSKKELATTQIEERALSLPFMKLEPMALTPWAMGYGTALPGRTWSATTEVNGRVLETHPQLDSGQVVQAGDLLLRIDDSDYQLRLAQRRADLQSREAQLEELHAGQIADEASLKLSEELLAVTRDDLQRMLQLKSSNAVSQSELDSARQGVLQQEQAVQNLRNSLTLYPSKKASAKASAALVRAQIREAERDIERTRITSPFTGVVSGANLEPGQIVGQNQVLFEIQDHDLIEIEAQVSLAQLERISTRWSQRIGTLSASANVNSTDSDLLEGIQAKVWLRSGNVTQSWIGKAVRIAEAVDEQTRTLGIVIQVNQQRPKLTVQGEGPLLQPVEREPRLGTVSDTEVPSLENPAPRLRPGSFCEIQLLGPTIAEALVVPRTAVDGDVIYVIDDQNRLRTRPVQIGFTMGELVVLHAGVAPGTKVVTRYPVPAVDGKLIDPRQSTWRPPLGPGYSTVQPSLADQSSARESTSR